MNPPSVLPGADRKRDALVVVAVVLAILVALPLLAWAIYRESGRRRVEAEIAAIRRAGKPVTWEELNLWYVEPPPGQNAAGLYIEAFAQIAIPELKPTNLPVIGLAKLPELADPIPAEMKAAIAECLQTNAAALKLLHQAASDLRDCRYPVDLTKGFATVFPHLAKARAAARILQLEAVLSAEEGQPETAHRAPKTGLAVGLSLRQEPDLIARLVTIAINGLMVSGLEQCVNRVAFTDAQLADLMSALADAESGSGMAHALTGERALGSGWFEKIRTGKVSPHELATDIEPQAPVKVLSRLYSASGLAEREEVHYLQMLSDFIAAARCPLSERVSAAKSVDNRIEGLPRLYVFCRMLLPALETAVEKDTLGLVQLEVARTALAVQRYRLAQGKLPAALGDLVPAYLAAVPVDAFDGLPIRYKLLPSGFVVYSVGRDGKDDGGRVADAEGNRLKPGTDITFTVAR
jgi:hypothetical protein